MGPDPHQRPSAVPAQCAAAAASARGRGAPHDLRSAAEAAIATVRSHTGTYPRLDGSVKVHVHELLRRAGVRAWATARGKELAPPRLHPAILRTIAEWFYLVDDDGSGTLEHHELAAALQAAGIPADDRSIREMVQLCDMDRDGRIGWQEFKSFIMQEFAAGKHLLSGEYLLPSGQSLPFGVMIAKLKRARMLGDVLTGGEARVKWVNFTGDLVNDSLAIAAAEAAIQRQKQYNETVHLHTKSGAAAALPPPPPFPEGLKAALMPRRKPKPKRAAVGRAQSPVKPAGPPNDTLSQAAVQGSVLQQQQMEQQQPQPTVVESSTRPRPAQVPRLPLGQLSVPGADRSAAGCCAAAGNTLPPSLPADVVRLLGTHPITPATGARRNCVSRERGGRASSPQPAIDEWGAVTSSALSSARGRELRLSALRPTAASRESADTARSCCPTSHQGVGPSSVRLPAVYSGGRTARPALSSSPWAPLLGPDALLPASARYLNAASTARAVPPGQLLSARRRQPSSQGRPLQSFTAAGRGSKGAVSGGGGACTQQSVQRAAGHRLPGRGRRLDAPSNAALVSAGRCFSSSSLPRAAASYRQPSPPPRLSYSGVPLVSGRQRPQ